MSSAGADAAAQKSASGAPAWKAMPQSTAAATRADEALRRARVLVLSVAAEVAAGGGRAAAEAILSATLDPDGRLRLPPPELRPSLI